MRIDVYVCDTNALRIATIASLPANSVVIYDSPGTQAETGKVMRFLVNPSPSPGKALESFDDKFIVVARRA